MNTKRILASDDHPRIDPEFESHLSQLDEDQFANLEADIVASGGPRDAIVVWAEEDIVVGGHHRFKICQKNSLPFTVEYKTFEDRDAVLAWMEDDQLNKRNLTDEQRAYYMGRQYNRSKKSKGGDLSVKVTDSSPHTAQEVAAKHHVSPSTVEKNGKFAAAVDSHAAADPKAKAKILAGKAGSKKAIIASAPVMCPDCTRKGKNPRVVCQKCEDLKAAKKVGKASPKPKKNGQPKADWKGFDKAYGGLVRAFDSLFLGLGKKNDKDYREANKAINELMRVIERVQKAQK